MPRSIRKNSSRAPRRLRLWQIAGIVLLLGALGILAWGYWPVLTGESDEDARDVGAELPAAKAAVEVLVLERQEFPLRAEAPGHLAAWRRAAISTEASGIVLERPIEEGQRVRQGDLLLQIDDREQQIRLKEAEAAYLQALADYAVKRGQTDILPEADTTALAAARERLQYAESAAQQGTLSEAELQRARRNFEGERLLSGVQRDEVIAVYNNLTQSEQLLERARLELSRTRLLAPFSGRVADLDVEAGQHVGTGTPVLALLEDDRMKVSVNVLEADLVRVDVGATANVTVPNFGDQVFAGRVYSINPSVDPDRGFGRVTIALANPDGQLLAGLHADVGLEVGRLQDRLVVPARALLVRQGRDLVFKVSEGRAVWTYVLVEARSGFFAAVSAGGGVSSIAQGDSVLVAGHEALAHDVPIEITSVRELGLR